MQFSFVAAFVALVASSAFASEEAPAPVYTPAPPAETPPTHRYNYKPPPHRVPAVPAESSDLAPPSYTNPATSSSSVVPAGSDELKTPPSRPYTPVYAPPYKAAKPSDPAVPKQKSTALHTSRTKYKTIVSTVHACPPGVKHCPYSETTSLEPTGVETVPVHTPSAPVYAAPSGSPPHPYLNSTAVPHYANASAPVTSTRYVTSTTETVVFVTRTRPAREQHEVPDAQTYHSTSTSYHKVTVYPAATPVTGPNAYHPKEEELKVPESYGPGPTSPTGYDSPAAPVGSSVPSKSNGAGEKLPSHSGPGPASPEGDGTDEARGASGSVPAASDSLLGDSGTCEAPTTRTITVTQRAPITVTETLAHKTVTHTLPPQTVTITSTSSSTATVNTEGPIQSSKKPHYPTQGSGPGSPSPPLVTGAAPIGTGVPIPAPRARRTSTHTSTSTTTITQTQTVTKTSSIPTPVIATPTLITPVGTPVLTPVYAPPGSAVPGQQSHSKLSQYIPLPSQGPEENKPVLEPPSYVYEPAMPTA